MKKIIIRITLTVMLLVVLFQNQSNACTGGAHQSLITPNSNWQTISGIQGGEYYTFAATAGRVYIFSFCQGGGSYVDDPQIQIMNSTATLEIANGYNDDYCGLGSELIWTCQTSGTYSVGFYEYYCQSSGTALGTVAYRYLPDPTRADCLGARPLCTSSNTINSLDATMGGNYYDLYNYTTFYPGITANDNNCPDCIIQGEHYSNWYTFTAQTSGTLTFNITPNNSSHDFDWAIWDMYGKTCNDLINGYAWGGGGANSFYNPLSCNYCGSAGSTGLNTTDTETCEQHVAGSCDRYNRYLNVVAGHDYTLFIDNYSNTTDGYSITFGGTASVYDLSPPTLSSLVYTPKCGSNEITVQFSEAVACTSMQNICMTVSGPNGSYTVNDISSGTCDASSTSTYGSGTYYDDVWTIELDEYLMDDGLHTVTLTTGCAADLCGNAIPSTTSSSLDFTISSITATLNTTHTCTGYNNGVVSVTGVSGGSAPYYYLWNTGATTASITGLSGGTYTVTVTDAIGRCEWVESAVVQSVSAPANDNCANATVIGSFPYSSGSLYTYCSTNDVPASVATCGAHYNNVWYRLTGTGDRLTATTCGAASFDTEIHVYTGACGGMTELTCNDDACGTQSSISWCSTAGTIYYISVGAYGSTGFGTYSLSVTADPYATPTASSNTPVCNNSALNLTSSCVAGSTYSWSGPNSFTSTTQNPSVNPATSLNAGTYNVTFTSPTGCTTSANTSVAIDVSSPSYSGYSNISGYQYQESATVYWVKGGNNFSIDITHSDNYFARTQYFGFNKDDCNPNGCGGAPNEIKSYNTNNAFTDWMADNNYIDITSANCVDGDGVCTDNDVTRRWVSNVKSTCADWDFKLHTYLYDHCNFGVGYTDIGLWVKVDNTAPTHDNVSTNNSCWVANGTNTYTITIVSTEPRSGFGGSYGMMALINYNLGEPLAGGYFAWHPTAYVHSDNQMACTGGGYVSKASNWGGSRIDLVSATTSVVGNQRTVIFTVRPHADFIELNGTNKISMYTSDNCNNYRGWTLFNTDFTVMRVPATPTTATTICNGSSTTLSTASTPATGITYYWQTSSTGTSTTIGSGTSLVVSPSSTTTYYVRPYSSAGCWGQASAGVTVTVTPNPSNDNCANATAIGSLPYSSGVLSTQCATTDNPGTGCGGNGSNVWFTVVGTGNLMEAHTVNGSTNFDTEIQVFSGTCGSLTEVSCNDDYSGLQSLTQWCSTNGTTYYISVGYYYNSSVYGNFVLSVIDYPISAPTSVTSSPSTICLGGSSTLSGTVGTNGSGISWYTGTCGGTLVGTGTSLSVSPSSTTTYYARTTGTCGNLSATCAATTVVVVADPAITTQPVGGTICTGGSRVLSVVASGGTPLLTYQWYNSGGAISGATSSSFTATAASNYYCVVSASGSGCGSATSNMASITVNTAPTAPTGISGTSTICAGQTTTLTATGGSEGSGCTYQWGTGSTVGSNIIAGATSSSYTTPALGSNTTYWVRRVGSAPCSNTTGGVTRLITVNPNLPVSVSIAATDNPICYGVSNTFTATPINGGGSPSYQWRLNGGNVGANSNTYVNNTLENGDVLSCILTSSETCTSGNPSTSNNITMTVMAPPTITLTAGDYVWSGNISTAWENPSNWLVYSGADFTVASVTPDISKNVFLRDYSPCASNIATTNVSSTVYCNDITIETALVLGGNSNLDVHGDWLNLGSFTAGTGQVNFTGSIQQNVTSGGDSFYNITTNNSNNGNADIVLSDNLTVTNLATFTSGIVNTNSHKLILTSSAASSVGNSNSFVDGVVERIGSGSFTIPSGDVILRDIGAGNQTYKIWAPITINPVANTTTDVVYLFSNSGLPTWWNAGSNLDATIHHVTDREYWLVSSTQNFTNATLYWKDNAHANGAVCTHSFCDGDNVFVSSDLTVAYWTGTIWRDAGGVASAGHDLGSITSALQIPFGAKSQTFITFASKDDLNPLPVELTNFKASCNNQSAEIIWQTLSETNNNYFVIEKSNGKEEFYEIARVKGAGNSNNLIDYLFTDNNLYNGDNYYRLTQVDYDGKLTVYDAITINCDKSEEGEASIYAYPNPFTDELNVVIENLNEPEFVLEIYDDLGRLVFTQEFKNTGSSFKTKLNLKEYRPAVYNLRSRSEGSVLNTRVVKR